MRMCDFSEGIRKVAKEEGKAEQRFISAVEYTKTLMIKKHISVVEAMNLLEISKDIRHELMECIEKN